ncbi:MAG: methyltransferase domain-containing protein [Myxococcales bacterium]|nr:methyltransferase domain-containing protein [Myxococcales bacterium]
MSPKPSPRDTAALFEKTAAHDVSPDEPLAASERQRIADTLALIPSGVESALDVGCGPGKLLHRLPVARTYGTDLGRVGLRHVRRPVVRSSILQLPFADASIDLVVCAEVLEHLDPSDVPAAAAELYRVARRHVLISVPYREQLLMQSHRCPQCAVVFHLYGHRQSMDEESLRPLFPTDAALTFGYSWRVRPYVPALLRLRTHGLGAWKHSPHTFCPGCGNTRFADPLRSARGLVAWKLCGALNHLAHPLRRKWNWLLLRVDKPA